jgi:hypothetical protein
MVVVCHKYGFKTSKKANEKRKRQSRGMFVVFACWEEFLGAAHRNNPHHV